MTVYLYLSGEFWIAKSNLAEFKASGKLHKVEAKQVLGRFFDEVHGRKFWSYAN